MGRSKPDELADSPGSSARRRFGYLPKKSRMNRATPSSVCAGMKKNPRPGRAIASRSSTSEVVRSADASGAARSTTPMSPSPSAPLVPSGRVGLGEPRRMSVLVMATLEIQALLRPHEVSGCGEIGERHELLLVSALLEPAEWGRHGLGDTWHGRAPEEERSAALRLPGGRVPTAIRRSRWLCRGPNGRRSIARRCTQRRLRASPGVFREAKGGSRSTQGRPAASSRRTLGRTYGRAS